MTFSSDGLHSNVQFLLFFQIQIYYEYESKPGCHATCNYDMCEYSIGGMMLKGHTFLEKTTANWLKCVDKCNDDIRCQSFNYVMTRGICELNDRTKDARPEHFVKDSERVYLKRLSKRGNCFPVIKVIVSSIFCEKSIHFLYANLLACLIDSLPRMSL